MAGLRVLTVGEALVDWICTERGATLATATAFTKAAGGQPLNVAVGVARLGGRAAFAGRLGDDPFGAWLGELLAMEGVDRTLATVAPGRPTRMAYVTTRLDGERELAHFSFHAADEALGWDDLPATALAAQDVLVFGTMPLAFRPARGAILGTAIRMAATGGFALFDPNARPVLWPSEAALREAVEAGLTNARIAKLGDDELAWFTGEADGAIAAERVRARFELDALVVTLGAGGATAWLPGGRSVHVPAFRVEVADPTGAGDGFVAGLLTALGPGWRDLDDAGWVVALRRANAVGAFAATRPGAIAALPTQAQLEAVLAGR